LSVYYKEPVEIGYAVLRVVGNENGVLLFEKVGDTYSSLTNTNQKISEAALATHAITASIVEEQGVNLQAACDTLKDRVVAAKSDGSTRVFGIGYNSDSFDMRMMQYSSVRHFKRENTHRDLAWYNFLKEMGVVGTIDLQRVLSSSMVIDGLNGKTSQVNAFKLDVGRDMTGAHRAAADVDGLVQILCDSRMSLYFGKRMTGIPLDEWFAHSNHSLARRNLVVDMEGAVFSEAALAPVPFLTPADSVQVVPAGETEEWKMEEEEIEGVDDCLDKKNDSDDVNC
jgi:hypothetical protein